MRGYFSWTPGSVPKTDKPEPQKGLNTKIMREIDKNSFLQLTDVKRFINYLKIEFNDPTRYEKTLQDYCWPENSKGLNFEDTYKMIINLRNEFQNSLANKDQQRTSELCETILKWGGVGVAKANINKINEMKDRGIFLDTLISARNVIQSGKIEKDKISFPANSGFSKIYACLSENFIIYDSRVAARMCFLISECFKKNNPFSLGIPDYQAKGNRNPGHEFPKLRRNSQKYFESNTKASWIIEELAIQNPNDNFPKEKLMFAYQTVFFVFGKSIPLAE